jgi:hypothetical protein
MQFGKVGTRFGKIGTHVGKVGTVCRKTPVMEKRLLLPIDHECGFKQLRKGLGIEATDKFSNLKFAVSQSSAFSYRATFRVT